MTMTDTAAEFSTFCPGFLDVLSIGKGDLRLEIGDNAEDREHAKAVITEMLQKGYTIFVETDDGPVRVMGFIPTTMVYLIVNTPEPDSELDSEPDDEPVKPAAKKRASRKEVPVAGSRATAVGRTAGG